MRTPVTSSNGDDGELGDDDGTSDGGSDLLSALDTESDVSDDQSTILLQIHITHPSKSPTATKALNRVR